MLKSIVQITQLPLICVISPQHKQTCENFTLFSEVVGNLLLILFGHSMAKNEHDQRSGSNFENIPKSKFSLLDLK